MRRFLCGAAALWTGPPGYFEHGKSAAVYDGENQDKAPQLQSPRRCATTIMQGCMVRALRAMGCGAFYYHAGP